MFSPQFVLPSFGFLPPQLLLWLPKSRRPLTTGRLWGFFFWGWSGSGAASSHLSCASMSPCYANILLPFFRAPFFLSSLSPSPFYAAFVWMIPQNEVFSLGIALWVTFRGGFNRSIHESAVVVADGPQVVSAPSNLNPFAVLGLLIFFSVGRLFVSAPLFVGQSSCLIVSASLHLVHSRGPGCLFQFFQSYSGRGRTLERFELTRSLFALFRQAPPPSRLSSPVLPGTGY